MGAAQGHGHPAYCDRQGICSAENATVGNRHPGTGIQSVKRCDSTSTVACSEIHRQSLVTSKSGPLGDTLYKCGECESGTYTGSDNVTRPLWVKRWRFLSPEACTTKEPSTAAAEGEEHVARVFHVPA